MIQHNDKSTECMQIPSLHVNWFYGSGTLCKRFLLHLYCGKMSASTVIFTSESVTCDLNVALDDYSMLQATETLLSNTT